MEALALHTGEPTVHWEDDTNFISVAEAKIVTHIVKHIVITVFFLQEQFGNGIFVTEYEKSNVMPNNMFTKPCTGPNISWSNKCMTGFRFYLNSDT